MLIRYPRTPSLGARPLQPIFHPTFSPHASTVTKKAGWHATRPPAYNLLVSADRRGVLQATLGPQPVEPARDLERRPLPDVLLEYLAVISDVLDDPVAPVLGEAELLAIVTFGAKQALHVGIGGFHLLIDVRFGHAQLLGGHHVEVRPLHYVEPLGIAVAHGWANRLLLENFR